MPNFSLLLPKGFDEYEWEIEIKGWSQEAQLVAAGKE